MTVSMVKTRKPTSPGWVCVDCLMWLANGETNPDWTEQERAEFLANFEHNTEGTEVSLGILASEHDETCPNNPEWTGDVECDCEERTFSWSGCDICGSSLGGSRHAVTFWI